MDVAEETPNEAQENSAKSKHTNIGALLIEARENKNLTAQDIADQMNLRLSIITNIEENRFDEDIPLAFIRGYIRSYAQKVGVDVETICVEFDRQTNNQNEPLQTIKVVSGYKIKRKEINSSSSIFKLVTFLIVASIVVFASWELYKRFIQASPQSNEAVNTIDLSSSINNEVDSRGASISDENTSEESIAPANSDSNQNLEPSGDGTIASEGNDVSPSTSISDVVDLGRERELMEAAVTSVAPAVDNVNTANIATSESTDAINSNSVVADAEGATANLIEKKTGPVASLDFEFTDDCWVKVTDANNEVLAIGIKRKGKVMPLTGVVPITVILGEPSAVSVMFQGEPYDLSRFAAGRRARFVAQ